MQNSVWHMIKKMGYMHIALNKLKVTPMHLSIFILIDLLKIFSIDSFKPDEIFIFLKRPNDGCPDYNML